MKLSYAALAFFLAASITNAYGEGSCSAQGGFDCPVVEPPPPKCPQGQHCPYKFGMNKAGDMTILQGDVPIALIPKADVHWNPAIKKALIENKKFSSNGLLVEMTKYPSMKFGPGAKFKPVDPKLFNGLLPGGSVTASEGSCSAQGGFDCPVVEPPPPKCPQGQHCPYKFGMNKAGDMTILQGDVPIALIPKADVHWNPAIKKALIENKKFSSNGLLVEMMKNPSMKFGPGAKFKPVSPDTYDGPLPRGLTKENEANPPKKK